MCQLGVWEYSPIQVDILESARAYVYNSRGEAGGYGLKQGAPPCCGALAGTLSTTVESL